MGRNRLYVGNLPRDIRSHEIDDVFGRYGRIDDINIKGGFAFVEFRDDRDAADACDRLDGRDYWGGRIRVEASRGRRDERGGGDRGRGGRFGGERRGGGMRGDARFKVKIEGLPERIDWRDVKDFLREGGDIQFCDVFNDGTGEASFSSADDVERVIKKLDGADLKGEKIKLTDISEGGPSGGGDRSRSRSRSPRAKSPAARSRSRSPKKSASRSRSPRRSGSRSPAKDE